MKTKQQKKDEIKNKSEVLEKSETLVIADITRISVNELTELRKKLRALGASLSLVKKRLLKLILEGKGLSFDRAQFPGQTAVVFSKKDLHETATAVYGFAKEKNKKEEIFKILGGYLVGEKRFVERKEVKAIGALPPREILLGQLVGMLSMPIKQFLFVLNEKNKTR